MEYIYMILFFVACAIACYGATWIIAKILEKVDAWIHKKR